MTNQDQEVRCPNGNRLFAKLKGQKPQYIDGILVEFACSDCKKLYRERGQEVNRVLHQFNILGEIVYTIVE